MADEFTWAPIRGVPMEAVMLSLRGSALRVLLVLLKFANKSMRCWPGREAILRYLPPDHDVRNLRRAMRELVTRGVVTIESTKQTLHDGRTGGQGRNVYTIHIPSLKKIRASYEAEKSVPRGVKNGRGGCQKRSSASAPYREVQQLKPKQQKEKAETPVGVVSKKVKGQRLDSPEDARQALDHFKALYTKKTGRVMPEFPRHLWIMDSLVRPGSIGLPATLAVCDLWFLAGPWAEFAKTRHYVLAQGMERCVEQIQSIPSYDERKRKYANG